MRENGKSTKTSSLSQKYYEDIIALMPGHVYWKDRNGVFLGCNLEQARDAGFNSVDEMIGKTDNDMPWAIQAEYLRNVDRKVMQSGRTLTLEEPLELPDGTKKVFFSTKLPLRDESNHVSGILGISIDITDLKRLEADLIRAKEQAEAANEAKTAFLENMRHDLRTPLTGIVGFAEIIKKEAVGEKITEYADNLIAASHMLLEFLNEILDAVKVLSGDLPTAKRKFSLEEMIKKTIRLLKPKALEKNLEIKLDYEDSIPPYMLGDSVRIQRILLELISNALNFTQTGTVTIHVMLVKKYKNELIIQCAVQDTGIGIPLDKQDEIFLRFKRLTPSYKGICKGTGLGLTTVKQFIDDIHGEIYCQSEVGKGTIFTCLFPLQESLLENSMGVTSIEPIKIESKPFINYSKIEKSTDKTRILLVEDQALAAKVASLIITGLDCSVDIASNGVEALKLFQINPYNLIFMDVGLPDMNGYELTKQIRIFEWKLDQHVPIVALTAHIDSENKQKCIESGMDAVLSKPLMQNTAQDIINAFVPSRKTSSPQQAPLKTTSTEDKLTGITGLPIDIIEAMSKINGPIEMAKELIHLLVQGFEEDTPRLQEAKRKNNWDVIKAIVHKYRGGSLYCGTPRFQQACVRLEDYLSGEETALREMLYQQLFDELASVREALKKI